MTWLLRRPAVARRRFEGSPKVSRVRATSGLIQGHLAKARHNLAFIEDVRETYPDWALVGCYYAAYHAVLALLASRGYVCKEHSAALCGLIGFFTSDVSPADLEVLTYRREEILYYSSARTERTNASYSTATLFGTDRVAHMQAGAIAFVRKAQRLLSTNP